MSQADDYFMWNLPAGNQLVAVNDLHEDENPALPRWFTAGKCYLVESMHPIADPPFAVVRCDDGQTTRLNATHVRRWFTQANNTD